jgi:hypothetical protein
VLDRKDEVQVIRVYRVDDIVTMAGSRLPPGTGDAFPEVQPSLPYMEMSGDAWNFSLDWTILSGFLRTISQQFQGQKFTFWLVFLNMNYI